MNLLKNLAQIPGWHTNRHIVVIESDDWGSIRMPSLEVREMLKDEGYTIDNCKFSSYDSLASSDDLSCLFDILTSVKDINGNYAILTADSVVANPDFQKIKESGYQQYYYEPFTETLKRYPVSHQNSFELWKEGLTSGIFIPQLHGREHLNVVRWMNALQAGDEVTLHAFGQRHFGLSKLASDKLKVRYMDSFGNASADTIAIEDKVIREATDLFEKLFGFKSTSFIAPCYIWRESVEKTLSECGVKYLQGLSLQQIPVADNPPSVKTKYHYLGQKNKYGQRYLIRNAFFEPYKDNTTDKWVDECLNRIRIAFRWHKPAIISSHRINFIGAIAPTFRDRNLKLFKSLLSEIIKYWPDVEFMSSNQLGDYINGK
ncbi:hypothetical protein DWW18_14910 [Butyricimonas virosa]|uniref:Polysaccharide (De)acetylase n=1 Tax=Butyricimonas virosa TaxID=544645 RepID=A0A412WXD0_9BACT|nr:hypothetical protein [Butyricimonas virosa]RGV32175.1 hypothetical protein DWW18_14910 [Butyricimonas virosa]